MTLVDATAEKDNEAFIGAVFVDAITFLLIFISFLKTPPPLSTLKLEPLTWRSPRKSFAI